MKQINAIIAIVIFGVASMTFTGVIDKDKAKAANELLDKSFRTTIELLDSSGQASHRPEGDPGELAGVL
jgi:hypothetical protein